MQTKTHNTKEQKGTITQIVAIVVFLFCFLTFPLTSPAFTSAPGTITGDVVWTKADSPYIVSTLYIPEGSSLTIEPGAVVKLGQPGCNCYYNIFVAGRLTVGSLGATERAVITSINDDIMEDTNGTSTPPATGDWRQIYIGGKGTLEVYSTDIRYGGYAYAPHVYFNPDNVRQINNTGTVIMDDADIGYGYIYNYYQGYVGTTTIRNSRIHDASIGLELLRGSATIEGNTFTAVEIAIKYTLNNVTLIHQNNHGVGGIALSGTIDHDIVLTPDTLPYVFRDTITIATGSSLTLNPGVILKMSLINSFWYVYGTLIVGSASSTDPVMVTSINDDTVGGDTNGDGNATNPIPGDWLSLYFLNGSSGVFQHADIRYGGRSNGPTMTTGQILNQGGVLSINESTLSHAANYHIEQSMGVTTVTDAEITDARAGILMTGGVLTVHNSNIHGNLEYGVRNTVLTAILATNNWWGSATGPTHSSNPTGTGGRVSDNVTFTPWLAQEPGTTTPPTCVTECYSNVLFLPGLEASRLYRSEIGFDKQLWLPDLIIPRTEELFLTSGGISQYADIYASDIIETAYGTKDIYHSFVTQMDSLKSKGTIVDWEAVPYDWRLSLENLLTGGKVIPGGISYAQGTSTPYIIQELKRLASTSKTGKVTIIAHSNGGLLTKALTNKLGSEASDLIDKMIFVAVPQAGTPQAIGAILHGYDQGLPFDSLPVLFTPEYARKLALNMPSTYNLLPSYDYFTYVQDPAVTFDTSEFLAPWRTRYGGEIHSSERLHTFIADQSRISLPVSDTLNFPISGNETLLNNAEALHDILNNWTPSQGVQLYEVAGWGEDTLATINYKEGKERICIGIFPVPTCSEVIYRSKLEYSLKEVVEGDGTVVVPSALWTATSTGVEKYWVNLRGYNNRPPASFAYLDRKHADILEVPELRTLIQNILINPTSTLPQFITTSQPAALVGDTRLRFVLHSPLNLSATDNHGNIISSATSTIPGGRFTRYGEVQVLKVPKGTPITLNLDGYASGSFTLDMQEIDGTNAIISSTTIEAIPNATSTKAQISFTEGTLESASPLIVDYDNNGTTDFTIAPKLGETVTLDLTPPEARISFSTSTQKFLIEGIDETSLTTVTTTATSSLITDEAGNTLTLMYKKFKQEKHELKFDLQTLVYNGIPTSTTTPTVLKYEWSGDTQGNIQELQQKVSIGTMKVEAHYDAKKNTTTIKRKLKDGEDNETNEILQGLQILKIVTEKGAVEIDY